MTKLLLRARRWRNRLWTERVESMVYPNKRTKRILWEARLAPPVLILCCIAYDNLPEAFKILVLFPLVWYAFDGAMAKHVASNAYKFGWFAGRSDLGSSLVKHVGVNEDGEFVGIHAALEEAHVRGTFAWEDFGLDKPPPPPDDDEDEEEGAGAQ